MGRKRHGWTIQRQQHVTMTAVPLSSPHRLADSPDGFSGGTTLFDSGTELYKSIFIGETDNKGLGRKRLIQSTASKSHKKKSFYFDRSFAGHP